MTGRERIRFLALCAALSLSSNFEYGFSTTYSNVPVDKFKTYLNTSIQKMGHTMTDKTYDIVWNLVINIWFVGFFVGIWGSPLLNDRYGRKVGFIVANSLSLVASVMRWLAIQIWQPALLFCGQLVGSVGSAVAYQTLIIMLQECSPTALRGTAFFISEICYASMCAFSMLLGTDQLLGRDLRLYLGFAVLPCFLSVLVVVFVAKETPKFLLIVKNDVPGAEQAVLFYHGPSANTKQVMDEIAKEVSEESSTSSWRDLKDLFRERHLRRAVMLSCCALQNTIALWSFLLSSTYFLEQANVEDGIAKWSTTAMSASYALGTIGGGIVVDRVGRRLLLCLFSCLNTALLALFVVFDGLQHVSDPFKYGCLITLVPYGLTYGAAVGPISWSITSELVPIQYRSLAQSLCYSINTVMVIISTFSVLPLYNAIGAYAFLPLYIIPSVFCLYYMIRSLPETKDREIDDIIAELKKTS